MKNTRFEGLWSRNLPREIQLRRVNRVIRQELTEKQREILLAYYFENLTVPEIAALRGVNRSTVSRTLHRAEMRLRKYLTY